MYKLLHRYHKPNLKNPKFLIPTKTLTLIPNSEQRTSNSEPFDERISQTWPEWVEFMDFLSKNGYFHGFGNPIFEKKGFNTKGANRVRTACLSFARERVGLIGYFSRKDIQAVVEYGCPVVDRKVVNSGKRLRAHFGINEENVCSSCLLRRKCERAYAKARESDGGYTVDVMRLLLTYGLDHVIGKLENKVCDNERVIESVRRLFKEMVDYSKEQKLNPQNDDNERVIERVVHRRQGDSNDWICSRCKFLNLAGNINCVQCAGRMRKSVKDHDHLALKKGDWLCEKCNFFNFAKNTRCLECNESPPKRQLNGGEWECDSCNYINFRRNMVCIRCDHRRPRALFA